MRTFSMPCNTRPWKWKALDRQNVRNGRAIFSPERLSPRPSPLLYPRGIFLWFFQPFLSVLDVVNSREIDWRPDASRILGARAQTPISHSSPRQLNPQTQTVVSENFFGLNTLWPDTSANLGQTPIKYVCVW